MATPRKKNPKKAGRKTAYKQEYNDMAYKYALLGLTDAEMAKLFGVSEVTFNGWKKRYPTFLKSINSGKDIADAEVVHSLVERAKGFEFTEQVPTKVTEVIYENGKRAKSIDKVIVTPVQRVVPPDTRAIQYWLNNRRRRRMPVAEDEKPDNSWAERHEIDHTTKGDKIPTPMVYLPQDLPRDAVQAAPATANEPKA